MKAKKQKIFRADGLQPVVHRHDLDNQTRLGHVVENFVGSTLKPINLRIAGPTADQVIATTIVAGNYDGLYSMDRQVLSDTLDRLVASGKISAAQAAAALNAYDAHFAGAQEKDPNLGDDNPPSGGSGESTTGTTIGDTKTWTLLGVTMKKLYWVLAGMGAVVLLALVVKQIAKR